MKWIFRLMAVVSIVFFLLASMQIYKNNAVQMEPVSLKTDDLHGFQNDDSKIPGLADLKKAFASKIQAYNTKSESYQTNLLWLGFLVTALTAAATLVSAIKAAKTSMGNSTVAMIIIAVLTFFATLGTWGTTQISQLRNEVQQRSTDLTKIRSDFYINYQKAADDNAKTQLVEKTRLDLGLAD